MAKTDGLKLIEQFVRLGLTAQEAVDQMLADIEQRKHVVPAAPALVPRIHAARSRRGLQLALPAPAPPPPPALTPEEALEISWSSKRSHPMLLIHDQVETLVATAQTRLTAGHCPEAWLVQLSFDAGLPISAFTLTAPQRDALQLHSSRLADRVRTDTELAVGLKWHERAAERARTESANGIPPLTPHNVEEYIAAVARATAEGTIDPKQTGPLLYAAQLAIAHAKLFPRPAPPVLLPPLRK